jgi:hypothetical protein
MRLRREMGSRQDGMSRNSSRFFRGASAETDLSPNAALAFS